MNDGTASGEVNGMALKMRQSLAKAVVDVCRSETGFMSQARIDGLIGITLDNARIILVNIGEMLYKDPRPTAVPVTTVARSAGGMSAGGMSSGGMSAGGMSAGGMSSGGMSAGGMSAGGMGSGGMTAGGMSAGGMSAGGMSAGGMTAGGMSADAMSAIEISIGGMSAGGMSAGGMSAGGMIGNGRSLANQSKECDKSVGSVPALTPQQFYQPLCTNEPQKHPYYVLHSEQQRQRLLVKKLYQQSRHGETHQVNNQQQVAPAERLPEKQPATLLGAESQTQELQTLRVGGIGFPAVQLSSKDLQHQRNLQEIEQKRQLQNLCESNQRKLQTLPQGQHDAPKGQQSLPQKDSQQMSTSHQGVSSDYDSIVQQQPLLTELDRAKVNQQQQLSAQKFQQLSSLDNQSCGSQQQQQQPSSLNTHSGRNQQQLQQHFGLNTQSSGSQKEQQLGLDNQAGGSQQQQLLDLDQSSRGLQQQLQQQLLCPNNANREQQQLANLTRSLQQQQQQLLGVDQASRDSQLQRLLDLAQSSSSQWNQLLTTDSIKQQLQQLSRVDHSSSSQLLSATTSTRPLQLEQLLGLDHASSDLLNQLSVADPVRRQIEQLLGIGQPSSVQLLQQALTHQLKHRLQEMNSAQAKGVSNLSSNILPPKDNSKSHTDVPSNHRQGSSAFSTGQNNSFGAVTASTQSTSAGRDRTDNSLARKSMPSNLSKSSHASSGKQVAKNIGRPVVVIKTEDDDDDEDEISNSSVRSPSESYTDSLTEERETSLERSCVSPDVRTSLKVSDSAVCIKQEVVEILDSDEDDDSSCNVSHSSRLICEKQPTISMRRLDDNIQRMSGSGLSSQLSSVRACDKSSVPVHIGKISSRAAHVPDRSLADFTINLADSGKKQHHSRDRQQHSRDIRSLESVETANNTRLKDTTTSKRSMSSSSCNSSSSSCRKADFVADAEDSLCTKRKRRSVVAGRVGRSRCPYCPSSYGSKYTLKYHIKARHGATLTSVGYGYRKTLSIRSGVVKAEGANEQDEKTNKGTTKFKWGMKKLLLAIKAGKIFVTIKRNSGTAKCLYLCPFCKRKLLGRNGFKKHALGGHGLRVMSAMAYPKKTAVSSTVSSGLWVTIQATSDILDKCKYADDKIFTEAVKSYFNANMKKDENDDSYKNDDDDASRTRPPSSVGTDHRGSASCSRNKPASVAEESDDDQMMCNTAKKYQQLRSDSEREDSRNPGMDMQKVLKLGKVILRVKMTDTSGNYQFVCPLCKFTSRVLNVRRHMVAKHRLRVSSTIVHPRLSADGSRLIPSVQCVSIKRSGGFRSKDSHYDYDVTHKITPTAKRCDTDTPVQYRVSNTSSSLSSTRNQYIESDGGSEDETNKSRTTSDKRSASLHHKATVFQDDDDKEEEDSSDDNENWRATKDKPWVPYKVFRKKYVSKICSSLSQRRGSYRKPLMLSSRRGSNVTNKTYRNNRLSDMAHCPYCSKSYGFYWTLNRHVRKEHNINLPRKNARLTGLPAGTGRALKRKKINLSKTISNRSLTREAESQVEEETVEEGVQGVSEALRVGKVLLRSAKTRILGDCVIVCPFCRLTLLSAAFTRKHVASRHGVRMISDIIKPSLSADGLDVTPSEQLIEIEPILDNTQQDQIYSAPRETEASSSDHVTEVSDGVIQTSSSVETSPALNSQVISSDEE